MHHIQVHLQWGVTGESSRWVGVADDSQRPIRVLSDNGLDSEFYQSWVRVPSEFSQGSVRVHSECS